MAASQTVLRMPQKRTHKDYLLLTLKGFVMGASDVVPGVSGGTMALILGIYQELVLSIKSFDTKAVKLLVKGRWQELSSHVAWPFLLSVVSGILLAIFSLARLLSWLLHQHPTFVWSFFFGLIMASVLIVSRDIRKWTPSVLLFTLLGGVGAYLLVGLMPLQTPNAPWYLVMSGAVAICAMILPGISGAFVLVLLGKYHYVLEAVSQRDFLVLGLVALGACIGLILFSRLLGWLLVSHHDKTVGFLTGLMIGSLRKIWPWKKVSGLSEPALRPSNTLPSAFDKNVLVCLLLMLLGLCCVLLLSRMAQKGPTKA